MDLLKLAHSTFIGGVVFKLCFYENRNKTNYPIFITFLRQQSLIFYSKKPKQSGIKSISIVVFI